MGALAQWHCEIHVRVFDDPYEADHIIPLAHGAVTRSAISGLSAKGAMAKSAWRPTPGEDVVGIAEVADWRLPDKNFLDVFRSPAKTGKGPLARANPFPRENRVSFDEQAHRYEIDGVVSPRSVTGMLHAYADPFDSKRAVESMRSGYAWEERRAEFEALGVNADLDGELEKYWRFAGEVARARGTLLHYHAEQAANARRVEEPHSPEFSQVLRLLQEFDERGWTPYRAELNLFHCGLRCAGQPDLLCKDADGRIVIVDWKRVPKLSFENRYSALHYPLSHLPASSYWLYALQCNVYRLFLETEYAMPVASMWLGIVHPRCTKSRLLEIPRMDKEMEALLEHEIQSGRATPSMPLDAPFTLL